MGFANITITGNVGGEPRVRQVQSKNGPATVINFRVATSHGWGERETTTWWSVDYFCKSDKARDYFTHVIGKGARVVVKGSAYQRSYTGNDGMEHVVLQIDADDIDVPKPALTEQDVTQPPRQQKAQPELDDGLPF